MSVLPLRGFLRTSRRKSEKVIYKVETFGLVVKKGFRWPDKQHVCNVVEGFFEDKSKKVRDGDLHN